MFVFFARPARSALLISGRRRTSISRSPVISTLYKSSPRSHAARLHDLHGSPISGSSSRPSAFRRSDFSPRAAASCLHPCIPVARHTRFLTLVSRIRPFAYWPRSQPFYAFHPHQGLPISMRLGRTTCAVPDVGSSIRPFASRQLSSPSNDIPPHHGLPFSMLLGRTSQAVPYLGSSLRPFAFRSTPSFTPAFISPGPSFAGARMLRLPPPTMTFTFNAIPPPMSLSLACG